MLSRRTFLSAALATPVFYSVLRGEDATSSKSTTAKSLRRSSPEEQGISSSAIRKFIEAADEKINTMHSFMLVRHGHVVAEGWWNPEAADKPHVLWSLSKSFCSTAVGLAVADKKLSLDDKVLKFFPEYAPKDSSANLQAMRVKDLLSMSAGHETEAKLTTDEPWAKTFLNHPVTKEPGTWFRYNTPATYMCSAIVQKVVGETVLDYLKPRLFEPLGIVDPKWDKSPQGESIGGYGLYLRTEDIAKFGQLYLQQGKWEGKQLLPAEWVKEATSKQVDNDKGNPTPDWKEGYGYQFWRCRHDAYRGDGKDGQFCVVMPKQDAVVAMTAKTGTLQAQLSLVWEHLLPAFEDKALATNSDEEKKLKEKLAALKVKGEAAK